MACRIASRIRSKANNSLFEIFSGTLLQSTLDISKLWGLFFTSSNYPKCKLIWTCKKVSNTNLWLEKAIKMYF